MIGKRYEHGQKRTARVLTSVAVACVLVIMTVIPSSAATARATTMKLEKTEGTATLKTQNGTARKISNGMHLYSGNTLATAASSYAYVSLDGSKAVKLDEKTTTTLRQSGKQLELLVKSGKLFFNVSSPLTEKESMNVRTSSMVAGIRGTCGVVEYVNPNKSKLYLIQGQVTLGYGENATTIYGGQTATVILREKEEAGESGGSDGNGTSGDSGSTTGDVEQKVYVDKLTEANVPIFAITEILSDPVLQQKIEATTDLKIEKIKEVYEESQNPEGTEEKKEEEKKPEETTSSGGSSGGSYDGGDSTGNQGDGGEPKIIYLSDNGDEAISNIQEAWDNGASAVIVSGNSGGDSEVMPLAGIGVPKEKELIVDGDVSIHSVTVATNGKLTIYEGAELTCAESIENNGTITNSGTFTTSGIFTNNDTITDTESAKGMVLASGSEFENNGKITGGITLESGSKLTNNKEITGNITMSGTSNLINSATGIITGGITLGEGSTLKNSGIITGSGDAVISLKGGTLILGEQDGSSKGSIKNTGEGCTIAVADNPKSAITWNDKSIKIYSSSDLDHAIQGLTKDPASGDSDEVWTVVVPNNLELSSEKLLWSNNSKMLYYAS